MLRARGTESKARMSVPKPDRDSVRSLELRNDEIRAEIHRLLAEAEQIMELNRRLLRLIQNSRWWSEDRS